MTIKFPVDLDTDAELHHVEDGVDTVLALHHNDPKDAILALEAKVGIDGSAVTSSIDFFLNEVAIPSDPPSGKWRVTNIYVIKISGKPRLHVEYEDVAVP